MIKFLLRAYRKLPVLSEMATLLMMSCTLWCHSGDVKIGLLLYLDKHLLFLHVMSHTENCCQLLRRFTPAAQYQTISSDVRVPDACCCPCLVTAGLRQCCAGGLTSLPVQPPTVGTQRCCSIDRRPATFWSPHRHTRQFPLVESPGACLVQAGDNRLSFSERHGATLSGCRPTTFVRHAF